jgi:K+-transporting ATPase KdpF subunit
MPLLYVVGGIVALGLLGYLVLALLKPELFT